jgi:hypothetical protein
VNWRKPEIWIALFAAGSVLTLAVVDSGRTAPGPLAAVHDREERLAGRRDCSECHGSWRRSMASACLDCHTRIEEHIDGDKGLHGLLAGENVLECARCHSEHHGASFAIVNRQSFAMAGVADPDVFDHGRIGFLMDGAHLERDCTQCHAHAADTILPAGETRYIGLDQDCATCHEDVHEGRMEPACAACHGQEEFTELRSLGHEQHLPLVGGHGDVSCRSCHAEDSPHALEAMDAGRSLPPRACQECHASPHASGFVQGVGRLEGLSAGASCVTCHQAEHTEFRSEGATISAAQHASSGFSLDAPHDQATCQDCHAAELGDFAARYPGRNADTCSACHEDPHGGQFLDSPFFASDCLGCHARAHFDPPEFDVEQHARTPLALQGRHAEIACNDCHESDSVESPRTFRGTPVLCQACHDDAHAGFFERREPGLARAEQGTCAQCHLTTTFSDRAQTGFDHTRWTGFDLIGAHLQSACETCHERAHEPDPHGRRFGRVEQQFGSVQGCASCHRDPHGGQFDTPGSPSAVDGKTGCARCHSEVSFRAVTGDFDHRRWTGFPLRGAHKPLDCAECHAPTQSDPHGRTWGRAAGQACNDCHADPHGGQFLVEGRIDCARCHTANSSFEELAFDHEKDARFALGEAHAPVACSACHPTTRLGDGLEGPRYRPLKMECADCHGVHEQPSLRRGKRSQ